MDHKVFPFPLYRLVFFLSLMLAAVFSSTAWAARTITIDPTSGPYNTTITVKGSGFNPKNTVTISYGGKNAVSKIKPDAKGNIDITITADGDRVGNYSIQASEYDANENFIGKSNALTFKQTTGKKSTHAIAIFDFPNSMLLATVDLKGKRLNEVGKFATCLGENSECFGSIPAAFPLGNGDLIVSTGLGFADDVNKYSAQQFNFHFNDGFSLVSALDGPVISETVMNRNCWYLYGDKKLSLTHLKGEAQGNVRLVGNVYHPDQATAGKTKQYLPSTDANDFVACFGTSDVHAAILEDENDFFIEYKGKDKVLRTLTLPVFVEDGIIISGDMTSRYELAGAQLELLIVRIAVPDGTDYKTQVFTLQIDVSHPQWQIAGTPEPLTKLVSDKHVAARAYHSVAIDPLGRFAVYTYPTPDPGVVKTRRLDPNTGRKIGKAHTVFSSTHFGTDAGPYGLSLSLLF